MPTPLCSISKIEVAESRKESLSDGVIGTGRMDTGFLSKKAFADYAGRFSFYRDLSLLRRLAEPLTYHPSQCPPPAPSTQAYPTYN
jgi:hypothetical protein